MHPIEQSMLPRRAVLRQNADGGYVISSPEKLGSYPRSVGRVLRDQAAATPDAPFLRYRRDDDWQTLTYGEVLGRANAIGLKLQDFQLTPDRPLIILSGNSVGHALVMLGAMLAGVPAVPVSPAYSLMSSDLAKIAHIAGLVSPGAIYAEAAEPFRKAIDKVGRDLPLLTAKDVMALPERGAGPDIDPGPDDIAKILFTSGSTGMPKGVINTHRMLCANQVMASKGWGFVRDEPPVLMDWLPWNHTFGGNMCFNIVLFNGGVFHIDDGKPAPGLIERTVENLRLASATIHFNVPAGFAALLPFLEADAVLREVFFRDLKMIMYAGAALPQDLWDRLEAVADLSGYRRPLLVSAWGSTETAPMATQVHFSIPAAGNIGLPCAGVEVRFAPVGDKLELRVKGPNVTPGYFRQPDLTASAFDDDSFYKMGDAGALADIDDPAAGIIFDGRVSEDFKLTTGTWVSTGSLRTKIVAACSPLVQDVVVCGHDREHLGLLIWRGPAATEMAIAEMLAGVGASLTDWNAHNPASSTAIRRFRILDSPPSIDANEITDKGYINQRAALASRAEDVEALFNGNADTIAL
jgi:feruloyl-CoA synthase